MNKNTKALYSLLFTVFIDMLGVGIVAPVLAALFFRSESPFQVLLDKRNAEILFGFFISAYPFGQFFGAPLLGKLSDKYGRKKILIVSIFGTFINYILLGIGIVTSQLWLIFTAKLVDGFTGGNIAVANSAIADISDPKEKAKNFGLIGTTFGLGFILGPFFGGFLSNPHVFRFFNLSTPFFFAAFLSFINLVLIFLNITETLKEKREVNVDILSGLRNLLFVITTGLHRKLLTVIFFVTLGTTLFTQFFSVFLIKKFDFDTHQIGLFFAYVGIWIVIVQGLIIHPLTKKINPKKILTFSILGLSIIYPILLLPSKAGWLYLLIPFVAFFMGTTQPLLTTVVSDTAATASQGETMGLQQSVQSLAYILPPVFSGFLLALGADYPILTSFAFILIAWVIYIAYYKSFRILKPLSNFKN